MQSRYFVYKQNKSTLKILIKKLLSIISKNIEKKYILYNNIYIHISI